MVAFFATSLFAQSPFVVSPATYEGSEAQIFGEAMSPDRKWVVGSDQLLGIPLIWNTQTNQVAVIVEQDSAWMEYEDGTGFMEYSVKTGAFHAVNNAGIAVGSIRTADYVSHPIIANCADNGAYTMIYSDTSDAGCEAYAISENGVIAGFYFSEDWTTYACVWTENGAVRTDLPKPTDEEMGFPVEYISARWISADANTIFGYAQDDNTGAWVALIWQKQNGEYVPLPISNRYFQTYYYDEDGNYVQPGRNPYFEFSPSALSANGQWVGISVVNAYDPEDWDADATPRAARMNVLTGDFEVLELPFEHESNEIFGIANNGTCAGRLTGNMNPMTWEQSVDGMIWKAGDTTCSKLTEIYPEDPYVANMASSAFSTISAEADYVMGYSTTASGEWTSFVMALPASPVAIDQVSAQVALYPNPATTQINVSVDCEIRSVNVINAMGQVVISRNAVKDNHVVIDTQNLPAGIYFVNVLTDKGQVAKRFSVVK